jgi:hypothetical protein
LYWPIHRSTAAWASSNEENRRFSKELPLEGLVEPLHLPGGRGAPHSGEPVGDPVLSQDALEQDLTADAAEPTGEALAVVSEDLVGDPVASQGR